VLTDNLYWYRVVSVIDTHDGDTTKVLIDHGRRIYSEIKLRIEGIDAPELKGDTLEKARVARDAARSWLSAPGRKLVVRTYKDPGSYDRYTAEIYDAETEERFSQYMLDNGFAVEYDYKWG